MRNSHENGSVHPPFNHHSISIPPDGLTISKVRTFNNNNNDNNYNDNKARGTRGKTKGSRLYRHLIAREVDRTNKF